MYPTKSASLLSVSRCVGEAAFDRHSAIDSQKQDVFPRGDSSKKTALSSAHV